MSSFFKFFDFFGNSFTPTVSYSSSSSSVFGGILGLAYMGFALFLIYHKGDVLILKNEPTVIMDNIVNRNNEVNFTIPIAHKILVLKKYSKEYDFTTPEYQQDFNFISKNIEKLIYFLPSYLSSNRTSSSIPPQTM